MSSDEDEYQYSDYEINQQLINALESGRTAEVASLLNEGADPNIRNDDGYTALTMASYKGHTEILKLLLADRKTDPNRQNENGYTPLMSASDHGYTKTVELLLKYGANPNITDEDTALMIASHHGHTETVEALLADPRTDLNIHGWGGDTALMLASDEGHTEIVKLLKRAILKKKITRVGKLSLGLTAAHQRATHRLYTPGGSEAKKIAEKYPQGPRWNPNRTPEGKEYPRCTDCHMRHHPAGACPHFNFNKRKSKSKRKKSKRKKSKRKKSKRKKSKRKKSKRSYFSFSFTFPLTFPLTFPFTKVRGKVRGKVKEK